MVRGEERENGFGGADERAGLWRGDAVRVCGWTRRGLMVLLAMGLGCAPGYGADKPRHASPAKAAGEYVASDAHEKEHVVVGVEPCDDPKACPFFRLPYIQHGFLPVRVVISNNSDKALSLDDVRIQFISANRDVLPAATPEDINRRLFTKRSAEGTKIPGIPITIHHAPIDKQVSEDDVDFGFPGTVVNAHSTLSGYLFYDVRGLDDPVMQGAEIYLKMIHTTDGKEQMFPFTIPLDRWLKAQAKNSAGPSAGSKSAAEAEAPK